MPRHVFTRAELYAQVWREPMRTVAQRLGLSDVGLAKACRAALIPVPPRGYWAKLQHQKVVAAPPPLPARPGQPDRVILSPAPPKAAPAASLLAALDDASQSAPIIAPLDLKRAHPIVRAWIEQNDRRRREARQAGWAVGGEDWSSALRQRQLLLYSALLQALAGRGFELKAERHPDVGVTASKTGESVRFNLSPRATIVPRPATKGELSLQPDRTVVRAAVPAGDLKIKLHGPLTVPAEYRELKQPLEDQLNLVIASLEAGIVELGEQRQRRQHRQAEWEAQQARRRRREAYGQAQAQQHERLLREAQCFEQAAQVRRLIAAAEQAPSAARPEFAAWKAWALEQAQALDPLASGSLSLALLEPFNDADAL